MKKDPQVFLKHILESIKAIEEYTKDLSEKAFPKFNPRLNKLSQVRVQ